MPADVRHAMDPWPGAPWKKRKVLRQGDVWILEQNRDNLKALPSTHVWDAATRTLSHNGHGVLHIPFPFRAYPQRTLAADGRYRRQAD